MCEAGCREQDRAGRGGAGSRDLVDRSSALRHSNKMATRRCEAFASVLHVASTQKGILSCVGHARTVFRTSLVASAS